MNIQFIKLAAIILAAGSGKRISALGAKPLLHAAGKTFIETAYGHANRISCTPIIIVTNSSLLPQLKGFSFDALFIVNKTPELGMLSSIQCGVAVLPEDISGFILMPVDFPLVRLSTVERLKTAHQKQPNAIIRPRYDGRSGHPVVFPVDLFEELLDTSDEGGARAIVHKHHDQCVDIIVKDPGIHLNINTVEDYEKYCKLMDIK